MPPEDIPVDVVLHCDLTHIEPDLHEDGVDVGPIVREPHQPFVDAQGAPENTA